MTHVPSLSIMLLCVLCSSIALDNYRKGLTLITVPAPAPCMQRLINTNTTQGGLVFIHDGHYSEAYVSCSFVLNNSIMASDSNVEPVKHIVPNSLSTYLESILEQRALLAHIVQLSVSVLPADLVLVKHVLLLVEPLKR